MGIKVICPGSFDPVTLGHIDIITRASKMFDHVAVGVLNNLAKTPSFSTEERIALLEKATQGLPNVDNKPTLTLSGIPSLSTLTDEDFADAEAKGWTIVR